MDMNERKSIAARKADAYFAEQCRRLGPIEDADLPCEIVEDHPARSALEQVGLTTPRALDGSYLHNAPVPWLLSWMRSVHSSA